MSALQAIAAMVGSFECEAFKSGYVAGYNAIPADGCQVSDAYCDGYLTGMFDKQIDIVNAEKGGFVLV